MTSTPIELCLVSAPGLRAWLSAAGYDQAIHVCDSIPDSFGGVVVSGLDTVPDNVLSWRPTTFKEVMSRALAVAAAVGCSEGMMRTIAAKEAGLKSLRDRLGIDRKAPSDMLPRCVVRAQTPQGDVMPGLWVPDLVDRAAGAHSLMSAGAPDEPFPDSSLEPSVRIIDLPAAVMRPGPHLYDMVHAIADQIHPPLTP